MFELVSLALKRLVLVSGEKWDLLGFDHVEGVDTLLQPVESLLPLLVLLDSVLYELVIDGVEIVKVGVPFAFKTLQRLDLVSLQLDFLPFCFLFPVVHELAGKRLLLLFNELDVILARALVHLLT